MEVINILGDKLAEFINISPPAARGLLKLAIKDELGPFKPLEQVNYVGLIKVIQNSLKDRLMRFGVKNLDELIKLMMDELTEYQSLLTLAEV